MLPSGLRRLLSALIAASVTISHLVLMAAGLARFDGQASVEQHNALIRPRRQIAVRGHGYAEVIRQLLVYIGQTTRNGWTSGATQKLSPTG